MAYCCALEILAVVMKCRRRGANAKVEKYNGTADSVFVTFKQYCI